jgi:hypothetical protein
MSKDQDMFMAGHEVGYRAGREFAIEEMKVKRVWMMKQAYEMGFEAGMTKGKSWEDQYKKIQEALDSQLGEDTP